VGDLVTTTDFTELTVDVPGRSSGRTAKNPFSAAASSIPWARSDFGNATIDAVHPPPWRDEVSRELFRELTRGPQVDRSAALRAIHWVRALPEWVTRKPVVSANDDSTFSVEWRTADAVLHVMFDGLRAEVYYENGRDEWETDLFAASDKLAAALRSMA
jgi:hypothetical protein